MIREHILGLAAAQCAVFISYRRSDASAQAGRLHAHLVHIFGEGVIFFDTDGVQGGDVWPDRLKRALASARVVLVLLGKRWLQAADEHHRRRIDDYHDWVRQEIRTALGSQQKEVIPVLVDGGALPHVSALPRDIARLTVHQPLPLAHKYFKAHVASIVERLCFLGIQPLHHCVADSAGDVQPTLESQETGLQKQRGGRQPKRPPHAAPTIERVRVHAFAMPVNILGRTSVFKELRRTLKTGNAKSTRSQASLVAITALGGVGKSTIAYELWRTSAAPFEQSFWFSFYDIRTRDEETFLERTAEKLGVLGPHAPKEAEDRLATLAHLIARRLGTKPTLLVLDGLEVVQYQDETHSRSYGRLMDSYPHLRSLLTELCTQETSRVLVTTRIPLWDFKGCAGYVEYPLDVLDDEAATSLLRSLGTRGTPAEVRACATAFRGHALSLRAAGLFSEKYHVSAKTLLDEVVSNAGVFRETPEGEKVARIVNEIRDRLTAGQEHFLKMIGIHRRSVDENDFGVVIEGWQSHKDADKARREIIMPLVALGLVDILESAAGPPLRYTAHALMKFVYATWFGRREEREAAHGMWARAAVGSPDRVFAANAPAALLETYVTAVEDYLAAGQPDVAWALYEQGQVHNEMHERGHMGAMREVMTSFAAHFEAGWDPELEVRETVYRCLKTTSHHLARRSDRDRYALLEFETISKNPERRTEAHLLYAQALAHAGRVDEALAHLKARQSLSAAGIDPECTLIEAEVWKISGDSDKMMALLATLGDRVRWSEEWERHRRALVNEGLISREEYQAVLDRVNNQLNNHVPRSHLSLLLGQAITCSARLGRVEMAVEFERRLHEIRRAQGLHCKPSLEILIASGQAQRVLTLLEVETTDEDDSGVQEALRRLAWRARAHARLSNVEEANAAITAASNLMTGSSCHRFAEEFRMAKRELSQRAPAG